MDITFTEAGGRVGSQGGGSPSVPASTYPGGRSALQEIWGNQLGLRLQLPGLDVLEGNQTNNSTRLPRPNGPYRFALDESQPPRHSIARLVTTAYLLPQPRASFFEGASPEAVSIQNNQFRLLRINGSENDHELTTAASVTVQVQSLVLGTLVFSGPQYTIQLASRAQRIEHILQQADEIDFPNLRTRIEAIRNPNTLSHRATRQSLNQLMQDLSVYSEGVYSGTSDVLLYLESLLPDSPDYLMSSAEESTILLVSGTGIDTTQQTEAIREVIVRLGQGNLRHARLGTQTQNPHVDCVMCGRTVPNSGTWVWCSHIVRWSDDEAARLDRANVAPMCRTGCDSAFEDGLITVNAHGIIELNENHPNHDLLSDIFADLEGNTVADFDYAPTGTPSSEYYQRNRERHLE